MEKTGGAENSDERHSCLETKKGITELVYELREKCVKNHDPSSSSRLESDDRMHIAMSTVFIARVICQFTVHTLVLFVLTFTCTAFFPAPASN